MIKNLKLKVSKHAKINRIMIKKNLDYQKI